MSIAFRGYDDVINESAVSTTTVPVPTGVAAGDVLVAAVATSAGGPITPDASGWTQLDSDFDDGNMRSALWWRLASSSEPASYDFTAAGQGSSVGVMGAWSGCDQTTPVSDADSADTTADDTSLATTAVTVPARGWLVTLPLDRRNSASTEQSWSSSNTSDVRRGEISGSGGSGSVFSAAVIDSARALTAGDHSRTITATRTWAQVLIWSIALQPAPEPRWPLRDRYELLLDGTWTDITEYVYDRDPVTIARGRSAEAQHADPAKMTLTLDNRDGRFSPRNPTSPYFGILGRNTQIRASLPAPAGYLRLRSSGTESRMSCPSTTDLNVTDLDVRFEVDLNDWGDGNLCGKYDFDSDDCSWFLDWTNGGVFLVWSPTGDDADRIEAVPAIVVPSDRRRQAMRVTLDVDNGDGGWTATWYTADSIDGTWTQLGDPVTGTGTTSIASSSADLEVGDLSTITGTGIDGYLYAFELRDGIDGTVVAAPDLDAQTPGDTSFTDDQGNTWTVGDDAEIDDRNYRMYGEVASWPATWRMGGHDAYVKVTASGVKRRLSQNAPSIRSPLFRTIAARPSVVSYWPLEDGSESTTIAASDSTTPPMTVTGNPQVGSYSDFTSSDPLPVMGDGRFSGDVRPHTPTGELLVRMFVFVDDPVSVETNMLGVEMTGSAYIWWLTLYPDGDLKTLVFDRDGNELVDSRVTFGLNTLGFVVVDLELTQDGSDIDWQTRVLDFNNGDAIDSTFTWTADSGTISGETFGRAKTVVLGDDGGLTNVVLGHVLVASDIDRIFDQDGSSADDFVFFGLVAWNGENPTDRLERLCAEEGVPFTTVSHGAGTGNFETLGDQLNKPLVDLLEEAAESDGGILFEPRDSLGFAYRSRLSMYRQVAAVTLDYSSGQVAGDLTPVDDDRAIINELTVKREAGSSVQVEETTGPLSTADPPDGVGRYPGEVTLSLESDGQLADQAQWRLHLGTVDQARFPQLTVNLRAPGLSDEQVEQVLGLDVGDRIVLTGIPDGLPPDDVSLLVQGYTETLKVMEHVITFTLTPESPWQVAARDDSDTARRDSADSTLAADVDADDTSWSVASSGLLWTTAAGDVPFDLMAGGERVTVTAISGTSSPQTFTVTRAANGVEKAHAEGTEVRLFRPGVRAL